MSNVKKIRKHYKHIGQSGRHPDSERKEKLLQDTLDSFTVDGRDISDDQEAQEYLISLMEE